MIYLCLPPLPCVLRIESNLKVSSFFHQYLIIFPNIFSFLTLLPMLSIEVCQGAWLINVPPSVTVLFFGQFERSHFTRVAGCPARDLWIGTLFYGGRPEFSSQLRLQLPQWEPKNGTCTCILLWKCNLASRREGFWAVSARTGSRIMYGFMLSERKEKVQPLNCSVYMMAVHMIWKMLVL